jgi:hypothetical protein
MPLFNLGRKILLKFQILRRPQKLSKTLLLHLLLHCVLMVAIGLIISLIFQDWLPE